MARIRGAILAKPFAVITTVQPPTACVRKFASLLSSQSTPLLIVGDSKGPFAYDLTGTELWTLDRQQSLTFTLAGKLPTKHYSRKNLGYLIAMDRRATMIYETDDDNGPLDTWRMRDVRTKAVTLSPQRWSNVYRWFSSDLIWPRGFPLESIRDEATLPKAGAVKQESAGYAPIQQGLADNAPDVDAVWRLVLDRDFCFKSAPSVVLPPGTWCPFNSQSTWWWPEAFPLLYLPSYCSFRMTDIWRGFVAQRCLWELGAGVVFHAPEVSQERNMHSLIGDFQAEVPGYLRNASIAITLDKVRLQSGINNVCDNLFRCYEALVSSNELPTDELPLVESWCRDLSVLQSAGRWATGDPPVGGSE